MGFFDKIKQGLAKTKASVDSALNAVFATFREVDEDCLLYTSPSPRDA